MSMLTIEEIFSAMENHFEEVVSWRRYMHQNPELSFQESETASYIADKLQSFGLEVKTNIGGHGLIGILKGEQPGKTLALRADFDALPIQDEKDVPYKSKKPGIMHACGHDGHTSALLGTAQTLAKFKSKIKGTIIFLFQPAEETPPGGAKFMVEEGVLDGVNYIFGAHLDSQTPIGTVSISDGYVNAAVDKFKIIIQGIGGHGARPQDSIDPIVIGSDIVSGLQKIVSRGVDPLKSAVVTIGVFQSGAAFNVIPDTAILEGTVRTYEAEVRKLIEEKIRNIVDGITKAHGATYSIDFLNGYPALYNHPEESKVIQELFVEQFSDANVLKMEQSMGAEDFSYYLLEKPGAFFNVGSQNNNKDTAYPHHHPKFDIDERALLNIEKAFVKIVAHYLF